MTSPQISNFLTPLPPLVTPCHLWLYNPLEVTSPQTYFTPPNLKFIACIFCTLSTNFSWPFLFWKVVNFKIQFFCFWKGVYFEIKKIAKTRLKRLSVFKAAHRLTVFAKFHRNLKLLQHFCKTLEGSAKYCKIFHVVSDLLTVILTFNSSNRLLA